MMLKMDVVTVRLRTTLMVNVYKCEEDDVPRRITATLHIRTPSMRKELFSPGGVKRERIGLTYHRQCIGSD